MTAAGPGQIETSSSSSSAYRNLVETCKSPSTRILYTKALRYFMGYLRLPEHSYDKLLEKEPKHIQMDICDFVNFMKKEHSSATVTLYLSAINKFYAMNDITTLNWKKIHSFEGEKEKTTDDRPYTHSEIQTLLDRATIRNRCIILLMASGGLRMGAIPDLTVKELEPIDKYSIYKINNIYRRSKSRYFSFCTPECRKWIDLYLDHRKRWGERITEDSPLFRAEYNPNNHLTKSEVAPITRNSVPEFMDVLLKHTGLRTQSQIEGQQYQRLPVMMTHGFRKFFETNAFRAGMDHMYIRRLMGQKSGLEESYLKLSEEELLEGDSKHVGYIGIIDQLTIDESNKLRIEVHTLRMEKSNWETMRKDLDRLEKMFNESKSRRQLWS